MCGVPEKPNPPGMPEKQLVDHRPSTIDDRPWAVVDAFRNTAVRLSVASG